MRPQIHYGMADYADYLRDESIIVGLRNEAEELRDELRRVLGDREVWRFSSAAECEDFYAWYGASRRRLEELQQELRFLAA
jgi:hypothetical protein